ncbi:formylglycine-generating enzyme family protein [Rhabdochromatium marinum]|uniref:formylglycine-generating enzyme family protein n=1 Tax=Rhabdochromatium marinum TaxID=48729 RepID=UPI001F5BB01F|nr:formylglycine-generating enzyme family protein [Rhabdochromatium marinum]
MDAAAAQLGLERHRTPATTRTTAESPSDAEDAADVPTPGHELTASTLMAPMPQPPYWMATELRVLATADTFDATVQTRTPSDACAASLPAWTTRPPPARFAPLSPWRALLPRLRRSLAIEQPARALDLSRVVTQLSCGELLHTLPRTTTRRWGSALQIIEDHSRRLVPYWQDQALVAHELARLVPRHAVVHAIVDDALTLPLRLRQRAHLNADYAPPAPGGVLVALGDLGALTEADPRAVAFWCALGREAQQAGVRAVALVPFAPATAPEAIASHWTLIPWERTAVYLTAAERMAQVEQLLQALAVTVRVEPGLLREVRRLLGLDAATEAAFWQHAAVTSPSSVAATLDTSVLKARRSEFDRLGRLRETIWKRLCAWRAHLPDAVFISEAAQLSEQAAEALLSETERRLLVEFFDVLSQQLGTVHEPSGAAAWFRRMEGRARKHIEPIWANQAVHRIWVALHADDAGAEPPPSLQPKDMPPDADDQERHIRLEQRGGQLGFVPVGASATTTGNPLGEMTTRNRWVGVSTEQQTIDRDPAFWAIGAPPSWATDWAWDDYGAWVEFAIEGKDGQPATQRLRWIKPGSFLMGSPKDELERYNDEEPQHEVIIRDGFWLFDTACPQDLWEAVMGENPSHFKYPDRPVESVTWIDVQGFIATINARLPGLGLSLPSEAQWEYACRAGTTTPFAFPETAFLRTQDGNRLVTQDGIGLTVGNPVTPELVNYNGNYPYADGPKGPFREKTIPVKALAPNDWGLYQMHGNVDEWVQDAWHDNYAGAPVDGSSWETTDAGAYRVIRGGSWNGTARGCRSTCRARHAPALCGDYLGFRCARVQVREPDKPEAERAELARPGPRSGSGRGGTDPTRAAGQEHAKPVLLRLDTTPSASTELPDAPGLEIRTDREILHLQRCAKPAWANAMGRDRFGLWAEFSIDPSDGAPVIQRLRWIPPGRFRMGSPEDEPGRYDDEGPPHAVTIGQGFWLFDTPCTQALWVALGLENPSEFQNPTRPVEQVSWDDIQQRFLPALNERIPGFVLPSEAQWEYACRAGTQTALYSGPIEILGDANAPALDSIAWYGGNSGVGFELENGQERSWLSDMQYPEGKAGTHPVGRKARNPWGLYDMLGNVWEWTQDAWHDSYEGAPINGSVWESAEAGAGRVIRGGSWYDGTRVCRSAYRNGLTPDFRLINLGFRCARVQVS